jgi:HSP20 family protein
MAANSAPAQADGQPKKIWAVLELPERRKTMVNSLVPRHVVLESPIQPSRGELDMIFTPFDWVMRGGNGWPMWERALVAWPPMDVCETEDAYLLEMDLPGVPADKVQVELISQELLITGGRAQSAFGDRRYLRVERDFGNFHRRIRFTSLVEEDRLECHFQDGVLRITIPKAENAKARKILVKS